MRRLQLAFSLVLGARKCCARLHSSSFSAAAPEVLEKARGSEIKISQNFRPSRIQKECDRDENQEVFPTLYNSAEPLHMSRIS